MSTVPLITNKNKENLKGIITSSMTYVFEDKYDKGYFFLEKLARDRAELFSIRSQMKAASTVDKDMATGISLGHMKENEIIKQLEDGDVDPEWDITAYFAVNQILSFVHNTNYYVREVREGLFLGAIPDFFSLMKFGEDEGKELLIGDFKTSTNIKNHKKKRDEIPKYIREQLIIQCLVCNVSSAMMIAYHENDLVLHLAKFSKDELEKYIDYLENLNEHVNSYIKNIHMSSYDKKAWESKIRQAVIDSDTSFALNKITMAENQLGRLLDVNNIGV